MKATIWVFLLSFFMLGGCAGSAEKYQDVSLEESNSAIVYIYRPKTQFQRGEKPYLDVDGKSIGKLGANTHKRIKVMPGTRVISARDSFGFMPGPFSRKVELEAKAGTTYYLRYRRDFVGVMLPAGYASGQTAFEFVSPETGKLELARTRYRPAE